MRLTMRNSKALEKEIPDDVSTVSDDLPPYRDPASPPDSPELAPRDVKVPDSGARDLGGSPFLDVPTEKPLESASSSASFSSARRIGLNNDDISTQATSFQIRRLSRNCSRGEYIAEDATGARFLKADQRTWSYKRQLMDSSGRPLYNVKFSAWRMPNAFYIDRLDEKKNAHTAVLKGTWKMTKLEAILTFKNVDGQDVSYKLRSSSWRQNRYELRSGDTEGENVIAYFGRTELKRKERKRLGYGTNWDLNVAGGVDRVLVCAVVMGIDEYLVYARQMAASSSASTASAASAGAGA